MNFRIFLLLVNFFFALCLCTFAYLLLEGKVDEFFERSEVVMDSQSNPSKQAVQEDLIVGGIHEATGLIAAPGYELVKKNCTVCHSAKLVTQNRATRAGWASMIDWMQETQGLWDLGRHEPEILDYLAANYAPEAVGRRANIDAEAIEWYVLQLEE